MHVERCLDCWEALTLASMLRRGGIAANVATPKTHGFWGIYILQALPA